MAILVDPIMEHVCTPLRWKSWCHMGSDDHSESGLDELHALARKIGLRREWFQNKPYHPHYDLIPSKRALAIRHGAVEVSQREYAKRADCNPALQRLIAANEAAEAAEEGSSDGVVTT